MVVNYGWDLRKSDLGYHVPAGTVLVSQNQVSCRLERYFGRPDDFLPSRWDRQQQDQ